MLTTVLCCAAVMAGALPGAEQYLAGEEQFRAARFGDAFSAYQAASGDSDLAHYAQVAMALCRARSGDRSGGAVALRDCIASQPAGPWTLWARAELADLLRAEKQFGEARPLYAEVLAVSPWPWWMDEIGWNAAEDLLATSDYKAEGYALLRRQAETTIYIAKRRDASRLLLDSPELSDKRSALLGILRSGGIDEAGKAMLALEGGFFGEAGPAAVLANVTAQVLAREAAAGDAIDPEGDAWVRLLLSYAARKQAVSGEMATALKLARLLAEKHKDSREAGETFWWLAWYLEAKDRFAEAAAVHEELARTCPEYYRADDALLAAGRLWLEAKQPENAKKAYAALPVQFPESRLRAEASYTLAQLYAKEGKTKEAAAAYIAAAGCDAGEYFTHRALGRMASNAGGEVIPIGVNGDTARLRTLPCTGAPAAAWDESLAADARVARLRFFAAHGIEAGRWESLALLDSLKDLEPAQAAPYYRAVAEAGYAHSALQFASAHEALTPELERLLSYPLAYWPQAKEIGTRAGVDPLLMLAIARQESTFRADIRSSAGATGVMQLMPATAKWLAHVDAAIEAKHASYLASPEHSLRLGAIYLQRMLERSEGNLVLALASYNGGPGNCDKWRKAYPGYATDEFIEAIPFSETRDYVKRVLGNYAAYRSFYAMEQ